MGRRKSAPLKRQLARQYEGRSQSGLAAGDRTNSGSAAPALTLSEQIERQRSRRRAEESGAASSGAVMRPAETISAARLRELRETMAPAGTPASWYPPALRLPQPTDVVRHASSGRWYKATNADQLAVERVEAPVRLSKSAAAALGRLVSKVRCDTQVHAILAGIPGELQQDVLRGVFTESGLRQETPPAEVLRLIRAFPLKTLSLEFCRLDSAAFQALLTTADSMTPCPFGTRSSEEGDSDIDEDKAEWEVDVPDKLPCHLHTFRLGSLSDLDLSFVKIHGVSGPDLIECIQHSLPRLKGLFLAGVLSENVGGPETVSSIARLLPELVVLDLSFNPLISADDLLLLSRWERLPMLHTLYLHECPLITPGRARSWQIDRKQSLVVLHV